MKIKLYLKNLRKPILFEVASEKYLDKIYEELMTHDIIKMGQVIFRRDEFLYIVVE